jgi:hypothetical protein
MNVEYKPVNDRTPRKIPKAVQIMTHMVLGAAFAALTLFAVILIEVVVYFWTLITSML